MRARETVRPAALPKSARKVALGCALGVLLWAAVPRFSAAAPPPAAPGQTRGGAERRAPPAGAAPASARATSLPGSRWGAAVSSPADTVRLSTAHARALIAKAEALTCVRRSGPAACGELGALLAPLLAAGRPAPAVGYDAAALRRAVEAAQGADVAVAAPVLQAAVEAELARAYVPPPAVPAAEPAGRAFATSAALLVIAYNRPDHLRKTLVAIEAALAGYGGVSLYISLDQSDLPTRTAALEFPRFTLLHKDRRRWPLGASRPLDAHYKWALDQALAARGHSHAVIVEDDLLVSRDFIRLFNVTAPLLDEDPTLWCVSSWNDNGFSVFDLPPGELRRTSFMPGLGWMLPRRVWLELAPKWPMLRWDWWMRSSWHTKGRDCIQAALSRNRNVGDTGFTVNARFFDAFLKSIAVFDGPQDAADFGDVRRLLAPRYDKHVAELVAGAEWRDWRKFSYSEAKRGGTYAVGFQLHELGRLRNRFQPFGMQFRGAYKGVLPFRRNGSLVLFVETQKSEFVPPERRTRPPDGLRVVAAPAAGMPCDAVCQQKNLRCSLPGAHFADAPEAVEMVTGRDDFTFWVHGYPSVAGTLGGGVLGVGLHAGRVCSAAGRADLRQLCPCAPRPRPKADRDAVERRLEPRAGGRGESCTAVCAAAGRRCAAEDFDLVNSCAALRLHLGCHRCVTARGRATAAAPQYDPGSRADESVDGAALRFCHESPLPTLATCDATPRGDARRLCPCL